MEIKKRMHQHHAVMMKSASKLGYIQKYTLYGNSADVFDDPNYLPMRLIMECICVQQWLETNFSTFLVILPIKNKLWFARVILKNGKQLDTIQNFESQGHALLSGLNLALRSVANLPANSTSKVE